MLPGSPGCEQRSSAAGVGVPRQQSLCVPRNSAGPRVRWSRLTGASTRRGAAESVRDQPRQPRMGAQRLADQIGAAGPQPFLKQAVGQQIGGDRRRDACLAARAGSRVSTASCTCGSPVAANPKPTRDPVSADSSVAVVRRSARAVRSDVPAAARITESPGRQPDFTSWWATIRAISLLGPNAGVTVTFGCPLAATWAGRSVRTWYPRDKNAGTTTAGRPAPRKYLAGCGSQYVDERNLHACGRRARSPAPQGLRSSRHHPVCGCRARPGSDSWGTRRVVDREPVTTLDHRRDNALVAQGCSQPQHRRVDGVRVVAVAGQHP